MAFQLPNQKLTRQEKIEKYGSVEEWGISVFDEIEKLSGYNHLHHANYLFDIQANFDLLNGRLNAKDFDYVTQPYRVDGKGFKFPAQFRHYDILTPKIEVLKGEEIKRPFNFNVIAINDDIVNEVLEEKKQAINNYLDQYIEQLAAAMGVLEPEIDPQTGEPLPLPVPEEIERYYSFGYKHMLEKTANDALKYLYKYCDLQDKFNKGWEHFLTSGAEIFWTGIVNGEPNARHVDIRFFEFDKSPTVQYIEDAEWAREWRWMTMGEVIDEYYDDLTEEQIERIENYKGTIRSHYTNTYGVPVIYGDHEQTGMGTNGLSPSSIVKVQRLEWKARRKVGFLQYYSEDGALLTKMVDEDYKYDKKDPSFLSIDWKWINEVWQCVKVADDIYIQVGPKQNQFRSIDNPSICKLGYTGVVMKNPLVGRMKQIQYMYNIIMYRLEMAFARAKGQTMVIDTASIPRSYGFDVERVLHAIDTSGVLFINSMEEAKEGTRKGNVPTFNQFQTMDVGPSRTVEAYLVFLSKLEQLMGVVSGITAQREGNISSQETVGGVERSVQQSTYITEPFFYLHSRVKWRVLTKLIEESQITWSKGKKIQYYMDDMARAIIDINGFQYSLAEFSVFVSDSTKDNAALQQIQQLAGPMLQAGTLKLSDFIAILESNSISESKQILKLADKAAELQLQEERASQQQMQQQQLQAQQEMLQAEMQQKDQLNQRDNDTKLAVAQIGVLKDSLGRDHDERMRANEDSDVTDNQVSDYVDMKRLETENRKIDVMREMEIKRLNQEKELKEKELKIKDKIASKPKPAAK